MKAKNLTKADLIEALAQCSKELELCYWYYCNSVSCEGIDTGKLLEVDALMEKYENLKK